MHRDQVKGSNTDGSAGADTLRGDIEQLPVEVEALFGAEKTAGKDKRDQQIFADGERIHLGHGHLHEGAGGANDEGGNAGEARGNGVSQGKAVERGDFGGAEIGKGKHDERVLRGAVGG